MNDFERGDIRNDAAKELLRLLPRDRMQRIADELGLVGTEEQFEYLGDLMSAFFTRGIEFGAVEVAAQQMEAGGPPATIQIAHVELP
jgi:hypothetical protein